MPMFFVWKLNRPLLERILITVLMALGLFATGAAVLKLYYLRAYNLTVNDSLRIMVVLFIWCRIEEFVLIASACAPFLKSPVEQILNRFGVPMFKNKTRELNSLHSTNNNSNRRHWYGSKKGGAPGGAEGSDGEANLYGVVGEEVALEELRHI
jgi:hypothetical protein